MKAGKRFLGVARKLPEETLEKADAINVFLYGSLSATGMGHGTHKAVLGGLLDWLPEECDSDSLLALFEEPGTKYQVAIGRKPISFSFENIHFVHGEQGLEYQNTLVFEMTVGDKSLLRSEFYSIGGGFIKVKGEPDVQLPVLPYPYENMDSLKLAVEKSGLPMHELILQNEEAISGLDRDTVFQKMNTIIDAMEQAVTNGLSTNGVLPGPIGLMRKAKGIYQHGRSLVSSGDRFLASLNAYALAASEENASGRKVVTAPTSGSAGVIPGIIHLLIDHFNMERQELFEGMIAAAAIGLVARHNASIAGAEVGCQGEVGVAASMAAALLMYANGGSLKQVENAAEIALEHHLGLTCDPVGGYVQIPCIERNAMGAVSAYNAYVLASAGEPLRQKVSFDEVVEAMRITGLEMSSKYKETAKGGLAVCCVHC